MTVYRVDHGYGDSDAVSYYVMPYSLKRTLSLYFGFDFRAFGWNIGFHPWYGRFARFIAWARRAHLSEKAAQKAADRLNAARPRS